MEEWSLSMCRLITKPTKMVCGILSLALLVLTGCGSNSSTYSILPAAQTFQQSVSTTNDKMDLLWVIDNSSSMSPLQTNLTNNFDSFISQFQTKGYDFHSAVTTTDAYKAGAAFSNNAALSVFKDGANGTHTGIFDILSTTPNLINIFVTNANQGDVGSGDERAFSSFQAALNNPTNAGFLRPNSFLAVIILSDEDDFSDPTRPEDSWLSRNGIPDHDYSDPGLLPVSTYVSYLDTLTNTTGATRRWSASAITVLDNTCLQSHVAQSPSSIIGQRYIALANASGGVLGSICDTSYATALTAIQENIIELGTQFYLTRTPVQSSITVAISGVSIPEDATNGWTYNATSNSIIFHGTAVPAAGAAIAVNFDPQSLNF
jgi:hypothetical protein